ncbi:MAG TPA: BON domain-containing protein [Azospirillaceae bacterium]|nr:BON domain-containing protein [Azospirillaceae bacterium]
MARYDDRRRFDQHGGYNYLGGYTPNPRGDGVPDEMQGGGVRFDPRRWEGRYGPRRGGGDPDDRRGFLERAGDEIATWFGSNTAEQRREYDARHGDSGAGHHLAGHTDGPSQYAHLPRRTGHSGVGPRNYARSDERIREDVGERLTADPYVDATDIEVTVSGREVTLSGTVADRRAKRRAEDIAESVSGVAHVQNNLRARDRMARGYPTGNSQGTDRDELAGDRADERGLFIGPGGPERM